MVSVTKAIYSLKDALKLQSNLWIRGQGRFAAKIVERQLYSQGNHGVRYETEALKVMTKAFLLYQEHNKDCCFCCCCLRASCKTTQKDVVTPCKVRLVSGFHDSRYGILNSLSVELGLQIPDSNCQDSDPWAQFWIPREKISSRDSRVTKQKISGFWNPDNLTWGGRLLTMTNDSIKLNWS